MSDHSRLLAENRRRFYLSFFDGDGPSEIEVNGFWLVRQDNPVRGLVEVHLYSRDAYLRMKRMPTLFG